jgi:hypothetical protein
VSAYDDYVARRDAKAAEWEGRSHEAYIESAPRHDNQRECVRSLLQQNAGEFVPGAQLEDVCGRSATRRVRELKNDLGQRVAQAEQFGRGDWRYKLIGGR